MYGFCSEFGRIRIRIAVEIKICTWVNSILIQNTKVWISCDRAYLSFHISSINDIPKDNGMAHQT